MRAAFSRTALRSGLGIVAVLGLVFAIALPAFANDLHQSQDISWDDPAFQGSEEECADVDLAPGEVLWHFVHTMTDGSDLPSQIHATFTTAGVIDQDGYSNGGGNAIVMYDIITGPDTLQGADTFDDIDNDGLLNLSHICAGPEESQSQSQSQSQSESQSQSQSQSESQSESQSQSQSQSESQSESQSASGSESESASASSSEGVLGGNPTPAGEVPDTAAGVFNTVPATILSLVFLGAIAMLVVVRLARER